MRYFGLRLVGVACVVLGSQAAYAQMGPMGGPMGPGMGGPGGGAQTPAGEEKKEGVAVEAPKTPGLLPTTPALPPPKGNRKRYKLLELNGYYRVRTEWDKDFWLGFNNTLAGGAPWPQPLSCGSTQLNHPCDDSVGGVNMRLRLEPTINLSEGTSVHIQADALDNLQFGSTPADLNLGGIYTGATNASTGASNLPPLGGGTDNQQSILGQNTLTPSLIIKRAWAEVALPIGVLKVGRMPNHWGMGVWKNSGGYDPINGTYDYMADYGDSVDRISFTAQIPGTPLRAMIADDWTNTGLTSNLTPANVAYSGRPIDLDDSDDVSTWVGVISKMESPQEFKDAVDRGETMFDYGVYFEYQQQGWSENLTNFVLGTNPNQTNFPTSGETNNYNPTPLNNYVPRHYTSYSASLWGKLAWGGFVLESELIGILGEIDQAADLGNTHTCPLTENTTTINNSTCGAIEIRKFGGVARGTWTGLDNKFHAGLESGFATGDQWSNTPQGNTNIAYANLIGLPGATELTQFIFNQEYKIDLIFWHQLVGAVTNAVYARPFVSYDITKSISAKVWNVTSAALKPVSTPGHDVWYGTEFDADLMYYANGIQFGISGGVLFPFSAEEHPVDSATNGGPGFGYGSGNTGDPQTAYTIMTRLILAF